MLIPRWHGTDEEGKLPQEYFKQLNHHGLFSSPDVAQQFLDFYLSFGSMETGDYQIAEVFLSEKKGEPRVAGDA